MEWSIVDTSRTIGKWFFLAEIFRSITVGMAASDIFHAFIRCHDIQLSTAQSLGVFHSYAIKQ